MFQDDVYPEGGAARDRWIRGQRPPKVAAMDPWRPHGVFVEEERADTGEWVQVATLLLASRECPWRCLMCDLWRTTLSYRTPPGAIPAQIQAGLAELASRVPEGVLRQIKLYNGGSYFDAGAVPPGDDTAVAHLVQRFERVVVECHPALVGSRVVRFRDRLQQGVGGGARGAALEVAMGLETAHPEVLERLNKRMTLDDFQRAAEFLRRHGVGLRAFVLVQLPFLQEAEALSWAARSIDFAQDCGATVVSLIPVRAGNGAMERLMRAGQFAPPRLETLEAAAAYGVGRARGRVFADLWDVERFGGCPACFPARRTRLAHMNRTQTVGPPVVCGVCGSGAPSDAG